MIKVILAENEPIVREGFKLVLEQDKGIKVIGCASDGKEAFNLCKTLDPDIVLMDLMMPKCDGIAGTKLIKGLNKNIKVLVLTTFYDEENIANAIEYGADGYILKAIERDEFISAVKNTAKGLSTIHHEVYSTIVKSSRLKSKPVHPLIQKLTKNEVSIINHIVEGNSNGDIASSLNLSEGRIRNMITEIFNKLNVKGRTQLAVFAVRNGLDE